MGNTDSTQKLGERVLAGKSKLEQDKKIQSERYAYLKANSPELLDRMVKSIADSFKSCSPFLEPVLLISWMHNRNKCKQIVLDSCRKVFSSPIEKKQFQWFKEYVFTSSIWFFQTKQDKYMYQELLNIAKDMSHDIIDSMDAIYEHLCVHKNWKQVIDIKTDGKFPPVLRQDDPKVGLLKDKGFKHLFESKTDDEKSEDMKSFVDSNLAINILTSSAKNINHEFQNHIKTVMCHYGEFKAGPMKKVERCVSKLENDYQSAQYPKCAKLLDLVRCSVTFNTVDQLIHGYNGLMKHINKNKGIIELARIKNGFSSDQTHGGYRDIKVNVIYKSQINPELNMICEIQLMLINYLQEKKRIHKLYSILREEIYFQMVVQPDPSQQDEQLKKREISDLKLDDILNVQKEVDLAYTGPNMLGKCSVDSELEFLGMELINWFAVVDMKTKKSIFEIKRDAPWNPWYARQTHQWLSINGEKYLSVQMSKREIKMFKVNFKEKKKKWSFKEDNKYRINLPKDNIINYCAFDSKFESILLVVNFSHLQKRSMENVNNITANIELEEKIVQSSFRNLSLSNDGSFCSIAGGASRSYFYVIDINNNKQYKMTSNEISDTYSPCFINGDTQFISVSDKRGRIEIWDIINQKAIKTLKIGVSQWVTSSASTNNILAIGSYDKKLRLYDVRNWECFLTKQYSCQPTSLHLTPDLKYLTLAGEGGDMCHVLKIQ